ncbi:Response regulator ArlR [Legionella massiliensis]|uniref:Response regulator ArlR n=1 Tax=Legionella massiliensis TaxID=1034943 RepID=A0A078KRJ8_9GAMM|nr:response regulator [Legionella massiliensis]CDZ77045.1 Response regulator ArlR [Legionella massiliensis]CEE12783.1 Response regulator ArlR [Legionella massiliensis]
MNPTHVLVVEDTLIAQMLTKIQLTQLGCLVDIAADAQIALEKSMTKTYDLILMDIGLGEGPDGFEVTSQIRMHSPMNKNTPVIAVTAHKDPEYAEKARAVGMKHYFNKPFTPTDIQEMLEHLNRQSW